MSRKLTTYRQPSIADRISSAATIEELSQWRRGVLMALAAGQLRNVSDKTRREWNVHLWARVLELLRAAPTGEAACYIYNVVRTWPAPEGVHVALEALHEQVCAALPSPAERLRASGVVIVGVTG